MIFADGVPLDEYFETTEGPFRVTGKVRVVSRHLFLSNLLIYPMTGKPAHIGVGQLLGIVRVLTEAMKTQGLQQYSLQPTECIPGSHGVSSESQGGYDETLPGS